LGRPFYKIILGFNINILFIKYIFLKYNYMDIDKGLNNINKMYEKLTYFDQYGASVILFIIITIVLIVMCAYCYAMINRQPIADDWPNQRCKPYYIPIAGFITKPDNMSISEYTSQNFAYCTQNILSSITGTAVAPATYIITVINKIMDSMKDAINDIRGMFNKIRTFFQTFTEEIMGRLMNIMIPLQQIIIGFKDLVGKIQGTMTAGLFTLLGSYYTLKSLMGAIAQFIIIILIAMAVMIAIFWIIPFTWGMAASMTAVFIALAIPMAIILAFMMDVLHVQTSLSIPSVKCFDKDTLVKMNDETFKEIVNIEVGDILYNNNKVTAKMKLDKNGSKMYNLNGVIVSDSHIVKYEDKWMLVSNHPHACKVSGYEQPFLYCLNTVSKTIVINDILFTDWDEIVDNEINDVKNNGIVYIENERDIHKWLDGGFISSTKINLKNGTTKQIIDINVGDILENGENVYGLVEINGEDLSEQCAYYFTKSFDGLGKNILIEGGPNLNICDKKCVFTTTLNLNEYIKKYVNKKEPKLYHLLTDKKTFYIDKIKFYDYNASIDLFLDKNRGKLLSMKYV